MVICTTQNNGLNPQNNKHRSSWEYKKCPEAQDSIGTSVSTFLSSLVMTVGLQNLVCYRNLKLLSNNKNTNSYILNNSYELYENVAELLYLSLKTVCGVSICYIDEETEAWEGNHPKQL